jgi:hypothetical protein
VKALVWDAVGTFALNRPTVAKGIAPAIIKLAIASAEEQHLCRRW